MRVPDGGTTTLELRDVCVYFGGVKAVDHVTLEFSGNKIFGLLGPNGSGKSTVLAGISRLVELTSGSMVFNGLEFSRARAHLLPRWGIARTFQTVRLIPDLSVADNVLLGAGVVRGTAGGRHREERMARAREAIERTGLGSHVRHLPSELSYGVQRRVEIARAIAMRPRVLLLDEPTAGMNKTERSSISELLMQLKAEGITQVLVEHDVEMMVDTCDYIYAMNFGQLIAQGTPEAVVRDPVVQEAYLGKERADTDA